jgi:hypothetical protein
MRPTTHSQSALRAPLNHLLGTEANVRLLRVLATAGTTLGPGELARRATLQPSGVRRAVDQLAARGIVEILGAGPRPQVGWREAHPLGPALRSLFEAEAARVERILTGLKHAAGTVAPPPVSVWIEGPAARGMDRPGDPLLVGVIAPSAEAENAGTQLRDRLAELEVAEDVTIELHVRTRADLAALSRAERDELALAISVFGLPPAALVGKQTPPSAERNKRSHAILDTSALALAEAVAAKLAEDPGLVQHARQRIARRLEEASSHEQAELREWDLVLRTMSPARLRRFLTDRGERATRLRQTLPFLEVLSPGERDTALGGSTE